MWSRPRGDPHRAATASHRTLNATIARPSRVCELTGTKSARSSRLKMFLLRTYYRLKSFMPHGLRLFIVLDPDGNRFTFPEPDG